MKARKKDSSGSSTTKTDDGDKNICDLTDDILHRILSFLDMRDVVRTSVLSKRWVSLWTSMSILNFNSDNIHTRFLHFVDKALLLRDGSNLERLCFTLDGSLSLKTHLISWIRYALRHNVQELCFDLGWVVKDSHLLPNSLFTSESLKALTLKSNPIIYLEIVLPDSVYLPKLKSLHLSSCSFGNEYSINKLLSSCTLLESLELIDCHTVDIDLLDIYLPKLKNLKLDIFHSGSFKLYAPNLTRFIYTDYTPREYIIDDLPSLLEANIDLLKYYEVGNVIPSESKKLDPRRLLQFLRTLHNVKDLTLSTMFIEVISEAVDILDSWPTQFGNLRCLNLKARLSRNSVHAITYLLKISPYIETLTLSIREINVDATDIGGYWDGGFSLEFLLYHLKYVMIEGVEGSVSELKFLEALLKSAMTLEKLEVFASKTNNEYAADRDKRMIQFSRKLLSFPRASRNIAVLIFS